MAIHTFSATTREEENIQQVKDYCKSKGISFSYVVIQALKESKTYEQIRRSNQSTVNK